jgi:curved DNA-binding protein CbpA
MLDFYKILDLEYGVSDRAIFNRFKRYSKKYHPKYDDSEEAKQKFIDVNVAYYILGYEKFKDTYDNLYRKKILHEDLLIDERSFEKELSKWVFYGKREAYEYLKCSYKEFYRKVPNKRSSFSAYFELITELLSVFSH